MEIRIRGDELTHLGKVVTAARKSTGMTQREVANKIGASVQFVSYQEKRETMSLKAMNRLCEALGYNVELVITDNEGTKEGAKEGTKEGAKND